MGVLEGHIVIARTQDALVGGVSLVPPVHRDDGEDYNNIVG